MTIPTNGSGGPAVPEGGHLLENGARFEPARRAPTTTSGKNAVPIVRSRVEIIAIIEARKEAKRQRDTHFDALYTIGEQIQSCGISITEAAFRGNEQLAGYHVKEARLMILSAIEAVKGLGKIK